MSSPVGGPQLSSIIKIDKSFYPAAHPHSQGSLSGAASPVADESLRCNNTTAVYRSQQTAGGRLATTRTTPIPKQAAPPDAGRFGLSICHREKKREKKLIEETAVDFLSV